MKTRLILIVLVLVVVVIGAAMFLLGNVDRYRPQVQAELQEKLNRPVTIGHLGLKLLPLSIKVEGLTIGEAPAFGTGKPFAVANEVFVSAGLFSLLRGQPEVKDLILDKPQIEVVRNALGVWNFSTLGSPSSGGNTSQSKFTLAELKIEDGQVGFTDAQAKEPRAVYDHIDLKLSDFAMNQQFGVEVAVHFPGTGKQLLAFKGHAGPLQSGAASAPPVSGHLSLEEVSLAGFNRFAAGTIPPATDTVASGDAEITSEGDAVACKGDLKLENTVVRGAKLDFPIDAHYDLSADRKQKKLQVKPTTVQLGSTTFALSGDVDQGTTPANLNVHVSTKDSSITQLAQLAGAAGVAFDPAYKVTGTLSADLTAKGPATAPQLSGSITGKSLEANGGEIKQPVSVPELDLTLMPDRVISNTFTARSGSTALSIAFTLSQYTTKAMAVDASLKTDGANIAELLNIAKAYGADGAKGVTGTGTLSLDVHAQGPLNDSAKLTYAGNGSITNAVLSTPALTKPLTIASANAKFSQNSVGLDNLVAKLGSTTVRGNLAAKNFAAPEVQFALSADQIDTDEMQKIAAAPAPAKPPTATGPAKPQQPSLFLATTGSGNLTVGVLKAQEIVLKNVSAKCNLNRGVVELSPFSADAFGGKAAGSMTADMRPAVPPFAIKIKMTGVDANALLSSVSTVKNTVYGSLSSDADLHFLLASSTELPKTLNGTLSFNLANGQLKNVNILGEISKAAKFLNPGADQTASSDTAIKKLSGTLNIVNGVANTSNLAAALGSSLLAANGSLNLVSEDINMHTTTTLGGANSKFAIPALVTGNMAHPKVTPDLQAIAKMNAGAVLGSVLGQKGGGLGGVLGGVLSNGQQQQKPGGNPLNSILQGLGQKKKQQ
jgi:uncharacterized protein involved in outer membrane biogenesis